MKGSSSAALRRVLKYIQRRWPLLALSILLASRERSTFPSSSATPSTASSGRERWIF